MKPQKTSKQILLVKDTINRFESRHDGERDENFFNVGPLSSDLFYYNFNRTLYYSAIAILSLSLCCPLCLGSSWVISSLYLPVPLCFPVLCTYFKPFLQFLWFLRVGFAEKNWKNWRDLSSGRPGCRESTLPLDHGDPQERIIFCQNFVFVFETLLCY